ncbi:uncharacterized protein F5891DRAFT_1194985 [Suillus fuscotomentosus]|uniref:Uncharacterized protein n=1 Tax=Suillus fuscotomentosus TaxID=1912939 RepID=A0AAD4DXY7_9AGAM|nr:uncharacterized protein F5891DRAFT_1194985 [Suillus fuscotomentosus]KAG1894678.1 hypothetical protein F5891DRAFT_1194985 [Suillus fuscotomentosus]
MHPTYMYVPECKEVLRLVQLAHEEHPFSGFSGKSFKTIGYLAIHKDIYPIYVDETYRKVKPWLAVIKNIGTLGITDSVDITRTHPLFESTDADGEFIRKEVKASYCRPNELGEPRPMWLLAELSHASVKFHPPLFPDGFPPPAHPVPAENLISACEMSHATLSTAKVETHPLAPPAPISINMPFTPPKSLEIRYASSDVQGMQTLDMQAYDMPPFDMQSLDMDMSLVDPLDLGNHIFWPLPSDISASGMTPPPNSDMDLYPELAWKDSTNLWGNLAEDDKKRYRVVVQKTSWEQALKLTKCLFLGSLWVGLHGNPFRVSVVETRRLITNSFLTSLRIDGKMYSQFVERPLVLHHTTIGWSVIRTSVRSPSSLLQLIPDLSVQLVKMLDNAKGELRKVLKGAMTHYTGFCGSLPSHRKEQIIYFVTLFNSKDLRDIQNTIALFIGLQAFRELIWAALFVPIEELAHGKEDGRVADLFTEEVCTSTGCLAQDTVCNLMTLVYNTMVLILKELRRKEAKKDDYCPTDDPKYEAHEVMNGIIMSVLGPMYENPCEFVAFTKEVTHLPFIMCVNVLGFDPKKQIPRKGTVGKKRVLRSMEDVVTNISLSQSSSSAALGGLPNNGGFRCYRSFTDISYSLDYFTPQPAVE